MSVATSTDSENNQASARFVEFRPHKMLAALFAHGKQPSPLMTSQPVPAPQSLKKGYVFHGALIPTSSKFSTEGGWLACDEP